MHISIPINYKSVSASKIDTALNLIHEAITALEGFGKEYVQYAKLLKPIRLKLQSDSKIKQLRTESTSSSELVFILFILAKLIMYLSQMGNDYKTSVDIVRKVISLLSGKK